MASIDISLGPIEAMASLGAKMDDLSQSMKNYNAYRKAEIARSRVPSDVRMFSSVTIPTPTARTALSFGGPSPGFYWLPRRLFVGGVTWKTVASGSAEVYVTGLGAEAIGTAITGPIVNALGLTDMVDQATTMPNKAYYSNRQVVVQANENLVIVFDTATAAQQYTAGMQVEVHRTLSSEVAILD
jgi:hypothetical protein